MKAIQLGIPFVFCVFLSLAAMFVGKNAMPAFYSFLPMCFFFVAVPMFAMKKRIEELERIIGKTKQ